MTSPSHLLDTNVLIYSIDDRDREKQERALDVVEFSASAGTGALPTQVLAEFSNVVLNSLTPPLPPAEASSQVELYREAFSLIPLTVSIVLEGIRGVREHSFSYYDAQIWAAARLGSASVVLSEDFNSGATIEGVTFLNPFADTFSIRDVTP
jgi:predicted nucleic acid-binding protein